MVLFGGASGPVPPLDPKMLNSKGSLFLTRPTLGNYISTRAELLGRAADLFAWVANGKLAVRAEHVYALADVARAHADLEARKTTGKVLPHRPTMPEPGMRTSTNILDAIGNTARARFAGRAAGLRRDPCEARVGESHRQHEGPHGPGDDRARRGGRAVEARRHGGRIHRRQHGRLAGARLRREGLPPADRHSNAFSQDKLDQMAAFGAELTLVPSEGGLTTKAILEHDRGRCG